MSDLQFVNLINSSQYQYAVENSPVQNLHISAVCHHVPGAQTGQIRTAEQAEGEEGAAGFCFVEVDRQTFRKGLPDLKVSGT